MRLFRASAATECAVLAGCWLAPVVTAGTLNGRYQLKHASSFASMTPGNAAP